MSCFQFSWGLLWGWQSCPLIGFPISYWTGTYPDFQGASSFSTWFSLSSVKTIWIGRLFGPPTRDPKHINWNKMVTHSDPAWGCSCGMITLSWGLGCSHLTRCVGAGWFSLFSLDFAWFGHFLLVFWKWSGFMKIPNVNTKCNRDILVSPLGFEPRCLAHKSSTLPIEPKG